MEIAAHPGVDEQSETIGASRPHRGWPLGAHFALLFVLFVALAAAAVVNVSVQTARDARADAEHDAQFSAQTAANELAKGIAALRGTTAQLAANPQIPQVLEAPQACQLAFAGAGGITSGHIDILRSDGRVACSSRKGFEGSSYAGESWLRRASRAQVLLAPIADRATRKQVALSAAPLPGGGGYVAAFADLEPIGPQMTVLFGGGRETEFLIISGEGGGTVLARSLEPKRWVGASIARTEFGAAGDRLERPDLNGTTRLYQEAPIEGVAWRVAVGEKRSAVLASAARLRNRQLALILGGLGLLLLAVIVIYRRAALPIKRLGASVRANAERSSPRPVPIGGPAEVAALGEDVNGLIAAVDRELQERRRAEEHALASERNYRLLFESSPLPMCITEGATGAILEANEAALAAYGYAHEELLAMTLVDLATPLERETLGELLAESQPAEHLGPFHLLQKDGTELEVRITSYPVSFRDKPASFLLLEDVGEHERFERRLRQTQRLESLGQLAGGVAHDFNNVLAVIGGFAGVVKRRLTATADREPDQWRDAQEGIEQIEQATERGARLTRQLLSFARQDETEPTVLDANEVVSGLEPMLRQAVGAGVQVQLDLADDLWPIEIDQGQLEQVVLNLAVNARDAMPDGGQLTIDTRNTTVDESYAASRPGIATGRYVRLRVSDTGTGMDEATIQHAFEPFFTTKPSGVGTGLGLATVYGIVTQAGGRAQIYSEPGHGTTFTALFLATAPVEVGQPSAREAGDGRETVLLVEDEDAVRDVAVEMLRRHGYTVLAAAEGFEALELASAHVDQIDLLVTDVVMPRMLGREVAARVSELRSDIRVLYVSGYAYPVLASKGTLDPGVEMLAKPFSEPDLLASVRRLLDTPARER
jgi:PAS domain S-box-containing protein